MLQYKTLWDFSIHTGRVIEAGRPNLVITDKEKRKCQITDFTVRNDEIIARIPK